MDRDAAFAASRPEPVANKAFPSGRSLMRLAGVAAALGLALTLAVASGATDALDHRLAERLSRGEGMMAAPHLREAVRDVTALGSFSVLAAAVVAASAYLFAARRRRLGLIVIGSALGATAFSNGLKMLIDRTRPDLAAEPVKTFTASFPSGHALLSAAIILTIGGMIAFAAHRRSERAVILIGAALLTLAIGTSRIWLGVHWTSDVLAGWCFGLAWAAMTLAVTQRVARRRLLPDQSMR